MAIGEEREKFWAVAEAVNVWQWRKEYINPLVLDGLQWSLEILHLGRLIVCAGSNSFPGWQNGPEFPEKCEFDRFLEAVKELTPGKFK
jgi:hypothetical protein